MRMRFWLVVAPAAWAAGFSVCRLAVSVGASRISGSVIGLVACLMVALFLHKLIDMLVAARRRD